MGQPRSAWEAGCLQPIPCSPSSPLLSPDVGLEKKKDRKYVAFSRVCTVALEPTLLCFNSNKDSLGFSPNKIIKIRLCFTVKYGKPLPHHLPNISDFGVYLATAGMH